MNNLFPAEAPVSMPSQATPVEWREALQKMIVSGTPVELSFSEEDANQAQESASGALSLAFATYAGDCMFRHRELPASGSNGGTDMTAVMASIAREEHKAPPVILFLTDGPAPMLDRPEQPV